MLSIEERIQDSQRWKKAQENLEEFDRKMDLIKKYPLKPMEPIPPSPPYTLPDRYVH